ncbi:cytochrome P450 [Aspergillus stella-maris]|uniref:cytochrome P450 n=1 Tax=Aspergillus stella-maris TaxID=1810926 RepID=UPI003CCD8336
MPVVYLRDPAMIRQLFITNSESISRCGSQTRGPFGGGKRIAGTTLITADGDVARRWHADMLRSFNNRPAMDNWHTTLVSIAEKHVKRLREIETGNDLHIKIQQFALDAVWSLGLGLDNASEVTGTQEWLETFGQYVQTAASIAHPLKHIMMNTMSGRAFEESDMVESAIGDKIDKIVLGLLEDNQDLVNPDTAKNPKDMNFLQRISSETGGTASQPTTADVFAHAKQIFSHGFSAPTLQLLWALRELSLRPDVRHKLRTELRQSEWVDEKDLQLLYHLPYLNAVVNEVLRLYPPIPTTARIVDKPVHLKAASEASITLPAEAQVTFSLDMLHHDPQIWGEDASEFRPERWDNLHANTLKSECKFVTFLTGPRQCPCSGYVLHMVKVFLAVCVLEVDLEVTNAAAVEKRLGPVSVPTVPLAFAVRDA